MIREGGLPVRRGPVQSGGLSRSMSVSAIAAIARRQWDRRSFARALFDQKALTVEGETAPLCLIGGTRPGLLQNLRDPRVCLAKKPAVAGVALAHSTTATHLRRRSHVGLRKRWIG